MSLADGEQISGKLVWKVDWPMRWAYEGVAFEPAGEDHHAPTGSFTVGSTLVREVFGGSAPNSAVYSFVSLAGMGGKMSGSAGGAPIPETALTVLEPAIVRWLYIRRLPSQSFAIDLSAKGVQKLYDEWDRFVGERGGTRCRRRRRRDVRAGGGHLGGRGRARAAACLLPAAGRGGRPHAGQPRADRPDRRAAPRRARHIRRRPARRARAAAVVRDRLRRAAGPGAAHDGARARSTRRLGPGWTNATRDGVDHARARDGRRLDARRADRARLRDPEGHARPARATLRRTPSSRSLSGRSSRRSTSCSSRRTPARGCRRSCSRSVPSARASCSSASDAPTAAASAAASVALGRMTASTRAGSGRK